MTAHDEWVVVDTETDGLYQPIHTVEIAAQRMRGWKPTGEPFRVLLNHEVSIHPAAEAVHGYSREYLRQYGIDPWDAHHAFHHYVGSAPLVAHNLSFDWDRVLLPEMQRMNHPITGQRGFCSLCLARRTLQEMHSHRLDVLKYTFDIQTGTSHRAGNDVQTLVQLLTHHIRPRLEWAGISGFEAIRLFSLKTPIRLCHSLLYHSKTD